MSIATSLHDLWNRFLVPIDDPGSRLFHVNVMACLLLIAVWLFFNQRTRGLRDLARKLSQVIFRRSYWWNRSTRLDYQVYLLNALLKVFLFIPFLGFSYEISRFVAKGLLSFNGGEFLQLAPTTGSLLLFTAVTFIWDDALRFFQHWCMHNVSWLWPFHKMHHSARVLTPLTLYRNHPMESALATLRNSLSLGTAVGVFIFLYGSSFSILTLFGVNLFGGLFNLLGANLRHSHIPLSFGWLDRYLISPQLHQLHHSRNQKHYNCNYGVSLTFWDRLIGSYQTHVGSQPLRFGLNERHESRLYIHLLEPFRWASLSKSLSRIKSFFMVLKSRTARGLLQRSPQQISAAKPN